VVRVSARFRFDLLTESKMIDSRVSVSVTTRDICELIRSDFSS